MLFHYRKNHGILLNMNTCTGGYCMSTNVEKTKKSLFAGKKEKASKKKPKPEKGNKSTEGEGCKDKDTEEDIRQEREKLQTVQYTQ